MKQIRKFQADIVAASTIATSVNGATNDGTGTSRVYTNRDVHNAARTLKFGRVQLPHVGNHPGYRKADAEAIRSFLLRGASEDPQLQLEAPAAPADITACSDVQILTEVQRRNLLTPAALKKMLEDYGYTVEATRLERL